MATIIPLTSGDKSLFSQEKLITQAQEFQTKMEALINSLGLDSSEAVASAQKLYQIAEQFKDYICDRSGEKAQASLEDILREREVPLPMACKMIEILSQEEIQFYDALKETLSKTARVFLELIVFQCHFQKRRIYKDTYEKFIQNLEKVLSTLPEFEVQTRFEITCAIAAAKKLNPGAGKWKELAKDHSLELAEAVVAAACDLSPNPVIFPLIRLSFAVYHNLEEKWYRDVWALRWYAAGRRITTLRQFEKLQPLMKNYEINPDLAFCIAQTLIEMAENGKIEPSLKTEIFKGRTTSLLHLTEHKPSKDSFWETRYHVLTYLRSVAARNDHEYQDDAISTLMGRWIYEQGTLKTKIAYFCFTLSKDNPQKWFTQRERLLNREKDKKVREKLLNLEIELSGNEEQLTAVNTDLEYLVNTKALALRPQAQSAGNNEARYDPVKLDKLIQERLPKKEALLNSQEHLKQQIAEIKESALCLEALEKMQPNTEDSWDIFLQ